MRYDALLAELEKLLVKEHGNVLNEIKAGIDIQELIRALEANDLNAAIAAMSIEEAAYTPLNEAIRTAFLQGGMLGLEEFPRPPSAPHLAIRFNVRNLRAESWLATKSSQLITQIMNDQREAIKIMLEAGVIRGDNPRTTALNLVGRINKATGRREGGVIGLTGQQANWLVNARKELEQGDFSDYLNRQLRDKRFDRTVLKAMREADSIPATTLRKILNQYQAKIERFRGEMIARTETIEALNAGQYEGLKQGLEKVGKTEADVSRVWDSSGDIRTRPDHRIMDGQEVTGTKNPFSAPDGSKLRYPGDTQLGASTKQTIMCRCTVRTTVNYG